MKEGFSGMGSCKQEGVVWLEGVARRVRSNGFKLHVAKFRLGFRGEIHLIKCRF